MTCGVNMFVASLKPLLFVFFYTKRALRICNRQKKKESLKYVFKENVSLFFLYLFIHKSHKGVTPITLNSYEKIMLCPNCWVVA